MNRNRRRAQTRHKNGPVITGQLFIGQPETLARIRPRCPDCDSEIERWTDRAGVNEHDATEHGIAVTALTEFERAPYEDPQTYADTHS